MNQSFGTYKMSQNVADALEELSALLNDEKTVPLLNRNAKTSAKLEPIAEKVQKLTENLINELVTEDARLVDQFYSTNGLLKFYQQSASSYTESNYGVKNLDDLKDLVNKLETNNELSGRDFKTFMQRIAIAYEVGRVQIKQIAVRGDTLELQKARSGNITEEEVVEIAFKGTPEAAKVLLNNPNVTETGLWSVMAAHYADDEIRQLGAHRLGGTSRWKEFMTNLEEAGFLEDTETVYTVDSEVEIDDLENKLDDLSRSAQIIINVNEISNIQIEINGATTTINVGNPFGQVEKTTKEAELQNKVEELQNLLNESTEKKKQEKIDTPRTVNEETIKQTASEKSTDQNGETLQKPENKKVVESKTKFSKTKTMLLTLLKNSGKNWEANAVEIKRLSEETKTALRGVKQALRNSVQALDKELNSTITTFKENVVEPLKIAPDTSTVEKYRSAFQPVEQQIVQTQTVEQFEQQSPVTSTQQPDDVETKLLPAQDTTTTSRNVTTGPNITGLDGKQVPAPNGRIIRQQRKTTKSTPGPNR